MDTKHGIIYEMAFQSLKDKYVKSLLETNAFIVKSIHETPFTKRNGELSYMFLDHSQVASSAFAYKAFIDAIAHLMQKVYGKREFVLCNVDSKISAQMVGSLAYILEKPQIIYRSQELTSKEKGVEGQFMGKDDWNLPVALPDDVASGGDGAAKNVGDLVGAAFENIKDIQIFVGSVRKPKPSTYKTHYIVTRDELLDIMWNRLSKEQKAAVDKERKGL